MCAHSVLRFFLIKAVSFLFVVLYLILFIVFIFYFSGQSEIEKACDMLFEKAESIDYRYDVNDRTVEGLLILPLYGSMPTGIFSPLGSIYM